MMSSKIINRAHSLKFIFLLSGYFSLHILLRVLVSDSLDYDEAEQALLGQWLLPGYTEQPPLYTWVQYFLFELFGKNVFAVGLLKNVLLFLSYLFVYLSAERLLKDTRAAILATSSLLLIPQIAWESQRDMTHTTLVVFAAAAVLWLALRLVENRTLLNYCLMGIFCGIGFLAKVNFALFLTILILTLLTLPEGRKLLFSRLIFISFALTLAISAYYFIWMFNNQDIVFSATHKFKQTVETYSIDGVGSFFTATFLFLTPLWLFYLFIFPKGYLRYTINQADFSNRFTFALSEGLVEVCRHDDAVVRCDAEKRDKADPHRYAQVDWMNLKQNAQIDPEKRHVQEPWLSIQPDHQEPTRPRHKDSGKDHGRGDCRTELEVQNHEDHEQSQR